MCKYRECQSHRKTQNTEDTENIRSSGTQSIPQNTETLNTPLTQSILHAQIRQKTANRENHKHENTERQTYRKHHKYKEHQTQRTPQTQSVKQVQVNTRKHRNTKDTENTRNT